MTYADLLRLWGEELPLWEASFDLDPPAPERIDKAAWEIARAARTQATIYRSEFDGWEPDPSAAIAMQNAAEMAKEAEKIEQNWPHRARG